MCTITFTCINIKTILVECKYFYDHFIFLFLFIFQTWKFKQLKFANTKTELCLHSATSILPINVNGNERVYHGDSAAHWWILLPYQLVSGELSFGHLCDSITILRVSVHLRRFLNENFMNWKTLSNIFIVNISLFFILKEEKGAFFFF